MTEERQQYLTVQQAQHIDVMTLGDVLAKSGYFVDAKIAAQAIVKVLAGQEMGIGPIASMTGIHIIQGKPAVGANIMAAIVKASHKYDFRVRQLDDSGASIEFFERQTDKWESIGTSSFSKDDAIKAGTKNIDKFPRNMYFARAMSNGVKWFCPDIVTMPMYSPDELGANVDWETGDIIDPPALTINTVTGEIVNGEPEWQPEPVRPAAQAQQKAQAPATTAKPPTNGAQKMEPIAARMPAQLRAQLVAFVAQKPTTKAGQKQREVVVIAMKKLCGDDDAMRHGLLWDLCGAEHTEGLTAAQASWLENWMGATKENGWEPTTTAIDEARQLWAAITAAQAAAGQTAMPLDVPVAKPEPEY
jgi:hypothetical protein